MENPHKKNAYIVAGLGMFSAVYDSSRFAWSPGYLAPRARSPGHLTTAPLDPPRVQQQQSRHELVSSCHGTYVCTYEYVVEGDMEKSHIGAIGFAPGLILSIHLLKVDLLIWQLPCLA